MRTHDKHQPAPETSHTPIDNNDFPSTPTVSVILPARNEAEGLSVVLPKLREAIPTAEVLVVDDGSDDDTAAVCAQHGATVIKHPYPKGNGAAIKTGARHARGQTLVFMDADGQHDPVEIKLLLGKLDSGFDMVVGARSAKGQANKSRSLANAIYNRLASFIVGQKILDLTSGFRAARAERFREFLHLLPNGFSYPTTSTMAFFRAGYSVAYIPINADKRIGTSHINLVKDGARFLVIIFKIGTLYSPLKIFAPVSVFFILLALGYASYTLITMSRFTNMSTVLFITAMLVFLIGLVSEQITTLSYTLTKRERDV